MQVHHESLHKQIADAERSIWSGDERRRQLNAALMQKVRRGWSSKRSHWLAAGVALAAAGLLFYPRRKAVMGLARSALGHPIGMALLQRNPMVAMVLPWLQRLMARP